MITTLSKAALVAGTAVATLALGAGPASARPTFTVSAGSAPTGTTLSYSGISSKVTLTDATTGTTLDCAAGSVRGTITTGSGIVDPIAALVGSRVTFDDCAGPSGLRFDSTGTRVWRLRGLAGDAGGVTDGNLTGVRATFTDTHGNCTFSVIGRVQAQYLDSGPVLRLPGVTPNLTVFDAQCFGVFNNGDRVTVKADYSVVATRAGFNPLTITVP